MANAKIIEMKAQQVADIKEKIAKSQSMVVFDYRGLTVEEVTALRSEMRKAGVEYVVLKNSIVERAAREDGIDEKIHDYLKGPSAFAFGYDDAVAPAKILKEAIKKYKKCEMLGSMMSPISGLAIVLDQIAKQKGEGAPAADAE